MNSEDPCGNDRIRGKVGIIHLDAHYDNQPSFNGEEYARCTPFARLYETEGVGIHGPRNAPNSAGWPMRRGRSRSRSGTSASTAT
ncbi:arginase family protein [Marinithermofilum abyssi]|uniref:arginase family protein n=1 Tax=Marinithermofilum abyssi TaxID=1571185 RepID=UPI003571740F